MAAPDMNGHELTSTVSQLTPDLKGVGKVNGDDVKLRAFEECARAAKGWKGIWMQLEPLVV